MRRILAVSAAACLVVLASINVRHTLTAAQTPSPSFTQAKGPSPSRGQVLADYAKLPLSFEPNFGQTDDRVNFLTRGDGYTVFLAENEAAIRLESASPESANPHDLEYALRSPAASRSTVVKITLAQSDSHSQPEALDPQPGRSNSLIGNDTAKERHNVPQFSREK